MGAPYSSSHFPNISQGFVDGTSCAFPMMNFPGGPGGNLTASICQLYTLMCYLLNETYA